MARVVKRMDIRDEERCYQALGRQRMQEKLIAASGIHGEKMDPRELVQEVEAYIRGNLAREDLCVNRIAECVHLHRVYLNRLFKQEMGSSIGQYIINERMKLAEALLLENKLSASAVAEQTGYRSYSNFNLAFKKAFGESPTQYVKRRQDS